MSTDTTAAWPRVAAVIKDDGSGEVNISGKTHPVQAEDLPGARAAVVELVAETADKLGRSVRATMTDPEGDWPLIIAADGTVEADDSAPARPRERDTEDNEPASAEDPAIATDTPEVAATAVPSPGHAEVPAIATATPTTRREARQSFLTQEQTEEPATRGWRGALSRVGLRMSPSDAERAERADVHEVSQHWPGPRTIAIVNGKGGAGKALAVEEPVLTPTGYRPIGELVVGDEVYGSDGLPHRVLGVFPQGERELFRVTFSDGTHVIADGDHLWEVEAVNDRHRSTECEHDGCGRNAVARGLCLPHYRQRKRNPEGPLSDLRSGQYQRSVVRAPSGNRIMTTSQLLEAGLSTDRPGRGSRHKFFVPVASAVQFERTETPLDPYFVGLLLGDGAISNPALAFSTADAELAEALAATAPAGVQVRYKDRYDYRITRTASRGPNPLRSKLEELGIYGLTSEHKFIPEVYRMGDTHTRLAVLQGLLDTDGSPARGIAATFTSVSEQLATDVKFIAETLGCVVSLSKRDTTYSYRGERLVGKPAWALRIKAPAGLDLFRLERKRAVSRKGQRPPYRAIESIAPIGKGQAVCISVDAADHLFLTRSCVPTHNTPSTVLLAAVFARYGGAGVLTWDNNQTRGTLGWRTEQGPHEATLLDLLPQTDRLLSTGAQSADLAHFVHHQTRDRYDVLRSKPMELASAQRVGAADVDAIHQVASKYYRLIFIDSGNDESDPMWRRMIDHTDQLVVATTTRDDHAEAGALLLEALAERDERTAQLAKNAVVVVNQADPKANNAARVADGYRAIARDAITIPHDPAMVDGVLRYGSLRPATQRAWLAAGAAVARGL